MRPKTGLPAAHGPEISKSKSRNQTYPNRRAPLQRHHAKISRFFEVSNWAVIATLIENCKLSGIRAVSTRTDSAVIPIGGLM